MDNAFRQFSRAAAWLALLSLAIGTLVSHMEQTAALPPLLMQGHVRYFASSRMVLGLPVEFLLGLWFLLASWRRRPSTFKCAQPFWFWSGLVVSAVCAGLACVVGFKCVPIVIGGVAAVVGLAEAALEARSERAESAASALRHDWALVRQPQNAVKLTVAAGAVALVAQYLALTGGATQAGKENELGRWFDAEPRLATADLVAPGRIRVVTFSDYTCPGCSFQIPEVEATVDRYRADGTQRVELVNRDFPLNSDCNPSLTARIHLLACSAAVAVRVVEEALGGDQARAFGERLYKHHGNITQEEIDSDLARLRLLGRFHATYRDELWGVRRDAELGASLGVSATPTIFIDGRMLRTQQPGAFDAVLLHSVRELGSSVNLSSTDKGGGNERH